LNYSAARLRFVDIVKTHGSAAPNAIRAAAILPLIAYIAVAGEQIQRLITLRDGVVSHPRPRQIDGAPEARVRSARITIPATIGAADGNHVGRGSKPALPISTGVYRSKISEPEINHGRTMSMLGFSKDAIRAPLAVKVIEAGWARNTRSHLTLASIKALRPAPSTPPTARSAGAE
jgi:hypothetical protein